MRSHLIVAAVVLAVSFAAVAHADWPRRRPPPDAGTGVLVVISRPWSHVKVDGHRIGVTPASITLPTGYHRIELRTEDTVHRERVHIRAGESVRVMHRF